MSDPINHDDHHDDASMQKAHDFVSDELDRILNDERFCLGCLPPLLMTLVFNKLSSIIGSPQAFMLLVFKALEVGAGVEVRGATLEINDAEDADETVH